MKLLNKMDPVEFGRRLKAARNAARVTQEQAAAQLGVVRTTIVAIERGDRGLTADEFVGLCDLYETSPGRILRPETVHVDLAPQFRRLPGGEVDRETLEITRILQELAARYVELERKLGRPLDPAYPPVRRLIRGQLAEQAEDAAAELRGHLGLGLSPIPDLLSLIELELRIRLFIVPLPSRVSGAYAYHEALGACILVNANYPITRQTWAAGHELGHFLTDRHSAEVLEKDAMTDNPEEQFANLFADALLMPAAAVRTRYRDLCAAHGQFSPRDLVYLARSFYVSPEAMARRLEQLRLFRKGTFDALRAAGFDSRTVRGILGESAVPSQPQFLPRYTLLAVEAYEKELISEGELAGMLRIGRIETRELVESLNAFSESIEEAQHAQA